MGNPLVADVQNSTTAYSGVSLLESAHDLNSAIQSGDWASVAMGAAGTALDALSMAMDPFGAILAAGVAWLMEHVGPLKDALDALAGNPDRIRANSETWSNIAKELGSVGEDLVSMADKDTSSWVGQAGDAYRRRAADLSALMGSAKEGSEGASKGVMIAGEVVAAVRSLVRDIIAELVGHLISWALQVVATLGFGLTWVVGEVTAAVAKTASRIADIVGKLVKALKALVPLLKKAGDLFDDAAKALKNIKPGKVSKASKPGDLPSGPKGGGTPKSGDGSTTPSGSKADPPPKSDSDGSTTPSGAKTDPAPPPKTDPAPPPKTPDTPGSPDPSPGGGGAAKGGGSRGLGGDTKPSSSNKPSPVRDGAVGTGSKVCKSDPVDVATGDVVMSVTDLELPGPLALTVERTHVSSYRAGRWFGPSWTSTVDQRLEIDAEHVCYFSPDGMILVYPLPAPGEPVLPLEGPRWPLAPDSGGYVLTDTAHAVNLRFGHGGPIRPLLAIEDGTNRIDVDHDESGAPRLLRHSEGYLVEFHTQAGRVVALRVLDPGRDFGVLVLTYGYDGEGRLTRVTDSSGVPETFDYDPHGRMTGWQDRDGTWYRYVYDTGGRCVRTVGDRGFYDGAFTYDRERLITTFTDSLGHTSEFHLNAANQLLREVDPLGHTTVSEWDRYDRLLSRTDPLGRTTRYEYDADGALVATIRPDGSRVSAEREPGGTAEPTATAVPGDRDLFGRRRTIVDRAGGVTRLDWTVEGKPLARVHPSGAREQWRYDSNGNELAHVAALGEVSLREYGPFGLTTATVDPTGARTAYTYDTELRLTSVTNPQGLTWRYVYDPLGRAVEEADFDGRVTRFHYDPAGQLTRRVNAAGEAVDYGYDLLGRVVERRTATETTTYTYDEAGRLASAANADSVVTVERDEDGRVTAHSVDGYTVGFTYDDKNGAIKRRTPSGVDSLWSYDEAGNPVALDTGEHVLRFEHDESGAEIARGLGASVVLRQAFDAGGRLIAQTTDHERRYAYRADGRLARIDDERAGSVRFQLDPAGRVTAVATPEKVETYRYDGSGNIVVSSDSPAGGPSGVLRYRGNTLAAAGEVGYTYDRQGRLVTRGEPGPGPARVWRYTWDALDRLTMVTTPDGVRWRYRYDPLGRRVLKQRLTADSAVAEQIRFAWDGTVVVEQEHTGAGLERRVTTWDHHPAESRPVAQRSQDGAGTRFHTVVTDMIGTPVELLDPHGAAVWRAQASLWGKTRSGEGTPLRFPGQYHDDETGLYYNVYRYYDPATGRYLSQDPLGLAPAPNPVTYVANPHSATDPLGLMCSGASSSSGPSPSATKKRPRSDDDASDAASTSSNKKLKTGHDFKPGDTVNDDLKDPSVDGYKNFESVNGNKVGKDTDGMTYKKYSENMGEAGALDYLKKTTGEDGLGIVKPTKQNPLDPDVYGTTPGKPWPNAVAFNGSNVTDVTYFDGSKMHVIEAKGGDSELKGVPTPLKPNIDGRVQKFDPNELDNPVKWTPAQKDPIQGVETRLAQGSPEYLKDVALHMKSVDAAKDDGRGAVGTAILNAQKDGNLNYVPIRTKVDAGTGKAVVSVVEIPKNE